MMQLPVLLQRANFNWSSARLLRLKQPGNGGRERGLRNSGDELGREVRDPGYLGNLTGRGFGWVGVLREKAVNEGETIAKKQSAGVSCNEQTYLSTVSASYRSTIIFSQVLESILQVSLSDSVLCRSNSTGEAGIPENA